MALEPRNLVASTFRVRKSGGKYMAPESGKAVESTW
jgi:hypothetical protein